MIFTTKVKISPIANAFTSTQSRVSTSLAYALADGYSVILESKRGKYWVFALRAKQQWMEHCIYCMSEGLDPYHWTHESPTENWTITIEVSKTRAGKWT